MLVTAILNLLLFSYVHSISQHPILIIVSYDAFRYNYFNKNATPFMSKLKSEGTTSDYLTNVFPTKTFPNHQSIATGLYPENHGVVGNNFYDPDLKQIVQIGPEMYNYNEKILPIWTLNEKAGNGRHSGIMMWPGGVYEYGGMNATYRTAWKQDLPWYQRIDTVMSWITDKSKPANLIMLYFEQPDTLGHVYGPESQTVFNLLQQLDNVTQYLQDKLRDNGLINKVNVIHLSDHGMSTVRPPQFINITQYLQPNTYTIADTSPCLHFIPKKGYEDDVYTRLKTAALANKNFKVYKKADLLPRWHYKNNRRIPPILAVAEAGYGFQDLTDSAKYYEKTYHITITPKSEFGVHGYDNEVPDMHPFFIAKGPGVKASHKVPPFSTLDLFNLFCKLLDVKATDNNGTYANIRDILAPSKEDLEFYRLVYWCVIGVAFVAILSCAAIVFSYKEYLPQITVSALKKDRKPSIQSVIEAQHLLEPEEI